MQRNEVVVLPVDGVYAKDIWSLLLPMARGKSVLNVGAAGNVEFYLDGRRELWMHERLKSHASELLGLDIDEESVAYANSRGEALQLGNCEIVDLGRGFDLIVMSEVIEHVNAPAAALENLVHHLSPGGRLFITTPNPTYYGVVLRALMGRSVNVYYDHVSAFFPENLVALCQRLGFEVSAIYFFNTVDTRSTGLRMRSWLARQVGRAIPRFASNFILIVEAP